MQRIKSQSTCQTRPPIIATSNRQKSKKLAKGYDQNITQVSKSKNLSAAENSFSTIKTISKTVSCSMKNLHVGNNSQVPTKLSVPTTSRMGKTSTSAISARILKQIVGYSHRSNKQKQSLKQQNEIKETIRLQIDLDQQINNLDSKEKSFKNNSSHTKSSHTNSSKKNKKYRQGSTKNNVPIHKIVQQFSPLTESPSKNKQLNYLQENIPKTKKYGFFEDQIEQQEGNVTNIQSKRTQTEQTKIKSWKESDFCFNEVENHNESMNQYHEISQNFKNIVSPKTFDYKPVTFGQSKQSWLKERVKSKQLIQKHKDSEFSRIEKQGKSQLKPEIERLTILLEHSTAILEEKYEVNFKDIIPFWKGIIQLEQKQLHQKQQIKNCEEVLNHLKTEQLAKKTELYELNRGQIRRRKQKQCLSKSSKDKNIQEAIIAQEDLRIKLSSKADYDHIILFNQKVVLSGQVSIENLQNIFVEMFENKLTKKFVLITKKQVANLSVYDSRLVQDFLKKMQELENSYYKVDGVCHKNHGVSQFYGEQQLKVEQIVEQIEQISVCLLNAESQLGLRKKQLYESQEQSKILQQHVVSYVQQTGRNISNQYKASEGFSFDFEKLLEQKYNTGFEEYKSQLIKRDQILAQLSLLDSVTSPKHQVTQILSNYQQQTSSISSKRGSISLETIPSKGRPKKTILGQADNYELIF